MNTYHTLIRAKRLISNRSRWSQGGLCGNKVRFDIAGAIYNSGENPDPAMVLIRHAITKKYSTHNNSISIFNDNHTHEEVMEVFDIAIKMAKKFDEIRE